MNRIVKQRQIIDRRQVIGRIDEIMGGDNYKPAHREALVGLLKEQVQAGYGEVRRRFEAGGAPAETLQANAFLIDQLVKIIFDFAEANVYQVANPTKAERLGVVAVGGYGRAKLAPFSDIDLLFLLPYKQTPLGEQMVEFILYLLWDLGLKVGHATRSIDECLRLSKSDVTIRTSLLDARWLWGSQELFIELQHRFADELVAGTGAEFVEAKLAERDQRHDKMGDARYVVEPNIKDGKGGLRDLQTLYWLAKYLYPVANVGDLIEHGLFTEQDLSRYETAQDFLWTVRCHLHYHAGRAEERLSFNVQSVIGERMGFSDAPGTSGVEQFMKQYFLVAKDVGDLTRVLCAVLEEQHKKRRGLFHLPGLGRRRKLSEGLKTEGKWLVLDGETVFTRDPVNLIRLFHAAQQHDLDIHPQALRQVTRDLSLIDDDLRADGEATQLFLEILSEGREPEISLRRLNEADLLGRFIPEFGAIVAQMQYDMYHTYTVDEHTIRAIGILKQIELGGLAEEAPIASGAIHEILSRRALYIAVFAHDLAKGQDGDHSILGAEIGRRLALRLGLSAEEAETISWLILHHLLMSHTAFRRDMDDPKTIEDFVQAVQSVERLRLLVILTVADIRAVGPGVWNNWKARLLRQLFNRALEVISGDQMAENRAARIEHAKEDLRAALGDWTDQEVEDHIATGYPGYWLFFDHETLVRHASIVRQAKRKGLDLHIETHIDAYHDVSEITVYTPDHPGLISKIAGAMALSGASVVGAKIVTLSDGMALDIFGIQDAENTAFDQPERLKRLWARIEDAVAGKYSPARELHKEGPKRAGSPAQAFPVAHRVLIDNKASSTHSVLEVNGRDRPGFLHDVTAALTALGLQISSAHISTYGERVVDVFYVKDVFGLKIEHKEKLTQIQKKLMETMEGEEAEAAEQTLA